MLRKKTEEKNLDFRGEEGLHRNTDVIKKHIPDLGGGRGGGGGGGKSNSDKV